MRLALTSILFLLSSSVFSQEQTCHVQSCRSQLMNIALDSSVLTQAIESSENIRASGVEALRSYFNSDIFGESFKTDYEVPPLGFPHNSALCQRKKDDGNILYQSIDCHRENFCADISIDSEIRDELCFKFPCSFFMGDISKCPDIGSSGYPTQIRFPSDIMLKNIELEPLEINLQDSQVSGCFNVNKLDLDLDVLIDMKPDPVVNFQSIGLNGIELRMHESRRVCVSATLSLGSEVPISNVVIQKSEQRFISPDMMSAAVANSTIVGLDGYSTAARSVFRTSVLRPMGRHFQESIESSVQTSLAAAFEERLSTYFTEMKPSSGAIKIETPRSSFISELGVSNMMVGKYADLLECSLLKDRRASIENHKCLTKSYNFGSDPLSRGQVPSSKRAIRHLQEQFQNYENVTSESLKNKLIGLREMIGEKSYLLEIEPLISQITQNQETSRFMDGIELFTDLQNQQNNQSLGVGLQGICNTVSTSTYAGRTIPNCAVQVYVDTNEFNRLMQVMYEDGRMCHRGRGDFVPELNSRGEQIYRDRFAQGSGCEFEMEEKKNGLKCYLNGAPQLHYDSTTGKYNFDMKTKHCYRGSVFAGQGRIGGDINFDISYNPSVCENGDLCLQDGSASWNVVPGTERYALREGSFLSGMVHSKINDQLTKMMSDTVRLSFTEGMLASVPLRAGNQVDKGEGFFGLCLEIDK